MRQVSPIIRETVTKRTFVPTRRSGRGGDTERANRCPTNVFESESCRRGRVRGAKVTRRGTLPRAMGAGG